MAEDKIVPTDKKEYQKVAVELESIHLCRFRS